MKAIRILSVVVLVVMLVGLVLGTACAGSEGEQGPAGVGVQSVINNGDGTMTIRLTDGSSYTTDNLTGPQGEPGPNMIVAMANIEPDGTINDGYNVTHVTYAYGAYFITLTGIDYDCSSYVTLATLGLSNIARAVQTSCFSNELTVHIKDSAGNPVQDFFHFVVLKVPT